MRSSVADGMAREPFTDEASAIVRSCVHCGFCNATCPTYQLTGDELEGPRGRIYLMKSLLETGTAGEPTRRHLDQCLVCRSCETTCPSGVRYGRLLELVRPHVYRIVEGPLLDRAVRWALLRTVPYRRRFAVLVGAGRALRGVLPGALARLVPPRPMPSPRPPAPGHARRVLVLGGCVQPVLNPAIDVAAAVILDRLGLGLVNVPGSGCCGALAHHLGDEAAARRQARANIDAWWPEVEAGAEAIVATSSGCGVQLKDYARLLEDDSRYAARARAMQALVRDPLELIDADALADHVDARGSGPIVVQSPCTLQHGQGLSGRVEALLRGLGFDVAPVAEAHLCCGSAGSYSVLHAGTAAALRARKLDHLMRPRPTLIVTANIGCQTHLEAAAKVPVRHWLEVVAERLVGR